MSRIRRAIEILEAINQHFQEGSDCVYRDGLILSDDSTLGNAIAECVGSEEVDEPVIPRSKRRRISYSVYTDGGQVINIFQQRFHSGWSGWIGNRKVSYFSSEETAREWLNEQS